MVERIAGHVDRASDSAAFLQPPRAPVRSIDEVAAAAATCPVRWR
jgi:hypothetical protein